MLSLALQLALVVLSSCGFCTTIWFRAFAMGSPLWVESAFVHELSIGTKTPSEPCSKILRDEVTLCVKCGPRYTLDQNKGFIWLLFQIPSGWGHPFRVEFLATRSRLKEFLGMSLWRHIAVPPPLVQCWDTCAIYKSFRECLLKWNFHIKINFNILT